MDVFPNDPLFQWLGIKTLNVAAGFGGGIVRGLINPGYTWTMRIASATVGAITAGYLTPPAAHLAARWFDLHGALEDDITGSVGFFLGLCGMTVAEMLLRWARHWKDQAPPPPLPPRMPPGKPSSPPQSPPTSSATSGGIKRTRTQRY